MNQSLFETYLNTFEKELTEVTITNYRLKPNFIELKTTKAKYRWEKPDYVLIRNEEILS